MVRQLRILASQFYVLRTGTLTEIRSEICTNRSDEITKTADVFNRILNTFGTRLASAVLNLLIAVIVSRVLGPEGKGLQGLILATIAYIIVFANLMGGGAIVYLVPRFNYSLLLLPAYVWTILTGLLFFAVIRLSGLIDPQYALHVSILAIFNAFASVNSSILVGKEKIKTSNLIAFIQPFVIMVSLLIAFFVFKEKSVDAYIVSLYISFFSALLISLAYLRKYAGRFVMSTFSMYWPVVAKLFRYGLLNQLAHIFQLLSFRMSFYWLEQVYSEAEVGIYSNAASLVESIWLISRSISLVQYARIANTEDLDYARKLTISLSKASMFLSLILLIILVVLPAQFFVFVFGPGFEGVGEVIRSLAPGVLFFNFALVGGHYFSGTGKYHVNTLASLLGLIISIILFAFMIPAYGMTGAGWATSISYTITAIFVLIWFLRESKMKAGVFIPEKSDFKALVEALRNLRK